MPTYDFRCDRCGDTISHYYQSAEDRHRGPYCVRCMLSLDMGPEVRHMRLIPSAPALVWHPTKSKS